MHKNLRKALSIRSYFTWKAQACYFSFTRSLWGKLSLLSELKEAIILSKLKAQHETLESTKFDISEFKINGRKFLIGIVIGITIYLALYWASTFYQSTTEVEIYSKLPLAFLSVGFFITFLIFGAIIPVLRVFFPKVPMPYTISGILVTFSIPSIYLMLTDPIHYVPFLKNLIVIKSVNGTQ